MSKLYFPKIAETMPDDALLTTRDLRNLCGIRRQSIAGAMKRNRLPKPDHTVTLNNGAPLHGWKVKTLRRYLRPEPE